MITPAIQRAMLEELYAVYNRRQFVPPDPLQFLHEYADVGDREIVGLIASSLAYGRVAQIVRSVRDVLDRIGSPAAFVAGQTPVEMRRALTGFKHRWTTGEHVADLLAGVKRVLEKHGSLGACFISGFDGTHDTVVPALSHLVRALTHQTHGSGKGLLPDPARGSACKRLHLFLRWMVRCDEVDPGGWNDVPTSKLVVPIDAHMHTIARGLGLTQRRQADGRTALEVTAALRAINPEDPVKYDFALTRVGIRTEMDVEGLIRRRTRAA